MRRLPSHCANVDDALPFRYVVEHSVLSNSQFPDRRNRLERGNEVHQLPAVSCFERRFMSEHFLDSFQDQSAVIGPDSPQVLFDTLGEANGIHAYIIAYAWDPATAGKSR
jgi:hypothetical protein